MSLAHLLNIFFEYNSAFSQRHVDHSSGFSVPSMSVYLMDLIRILTSDLTRNLMDSVNAVYRDVHHPDLRASD
jgi:hypothetical protein